MGYLVIIRPVNCLITFVSVLVGAWIGLRIIISFPLILAGIIGFLACAFGNVINDLQDIEIDRINNPQRPLVSGRMKRGEATIFGLVLCAAALVSSLILGLRVFCLVAVVLILLYLYATLVKPTPLANFLVALITSASFILGGLVRNNPNAWWPALFAFFIHLAREIIKDVIDIRGDQAGNVRSLPMLWGIKPALRMSILVLIVLCGLLPLPFLCGVLSERYLIIVLILAYPLIIYTILRLPRFSREEELKDLSRLLKITMAVGLGAMIV